MYRYDESSEIVKYDDDDDNSNDSITFHKQTCIRRQYVYRYSKYIKMSVINCAGKWRKWIVYTSFPVVMCIHTQ